MGKCNHFALCLEKPYLFLGTFFSPVYIYLPSNLSQQSLCLEYTYPVSASTLSMCGRGWCEVSYNRNQTLTTTVTHCAGHRHVVQSCMYVCMYVCIQEGRSLASLHTPLTYSECRPHWPHACVCSQMTVAQQRTIV